MRSSPGPAASTSAATPTPTWCSVTARTSAWAPTWPAPRSARCSMRSWPARPPSVTRGSRLTCVRTSSAVSSGCRSPGPDRSREGGRRVGQSGGMTTAMRAISQDVLGGPEVLKLVELDRPEAGVSQVLVRVHAAGLNPTDWKHRARRIFLGPPPFVLGWDVSGVVEATGYGVTLGRPRRNDRDRRPGDPGEAPPGHRRHLPPADAAKAHQAGDTGHVAGKLVLTIR